MDRSPEPFAVTGAAVIDGTGGPVLPDRTVLVRGGVIERIDPAGAVTPPPGTRRIEGAGRSLLPGFIDTHVHLDFYPPAAVLRGGVTSVRDLGWPAGRLEALRRGAERSPTSSPRLLAAGQMVTSPGGYPSSAAWAPPGTAVEVEGTEQAAAAVAELAAAGASVIKVALDPTRGAPTLPAPTLAAVVAAAAERRLDVTAHVAGPAEVAKALDAGVTELAHWPFGEEPRGDLIRRMAASMTVVPTLHIDPSPARRRGVRAFVAAGGRGTAPTSATRDRRPRSTWPSWSCSWRRGSPLSARWRRRPRMPPSTLGSGRSAAWRRDGWRTCCWSTVTRWKTCGH